MTYFTLAHQHSGDLSKFVLPLLGFSSRPRRPSRYEERKEIVHDVGCGDARDIGVVVGGCNFDDVRAAE
jgi:hypothetical protein